MNNKYYISINIENNQYVGKVYLTNTNQLVYTSKGYSTQEQATADTRTFVITEAPPTTEPKLSETIVSTSNYISTRPIHGYGGGRCCGR